MFQEGLEYLMLKTTWKAEIRKEEFLGLPQGLKIELFNRSLGTLMGFFSPSAMPLFTRNDSPYGLLGTTPSLSRGSDLPTAFSAMTLKKYSVPSFKFCTQ